MQVVDDWTILFRDNSTLYLQKPRGGCPGLANDMTLVRNQFGTGRRLCSGDLNRVVNPRTGFDTGSCVYSDFVPYRKLR